MDQIRFTQIAIGPWKTTEATLNHNVYGLGEDGQVYKYTNSGGWRNITHKDVVSQPRKKTQAKEDF